MPAAAVIPARIAYIKVVAVKKLIVGSRAPAGSAAALEVKLFYRRKMNEGESICQGCFR